MHTNWETSNQTNANPNVSTGRKLKKLCYALASNFQASLFNLNCSEYDHQSIMHYGGSRKVCKKFNDPYMTLKPSRQEIPVNKELSVLDIQALKKFYAPPSK